jgi:hypothetical protein
MSAVWLKSPKAITVVWFLTTAVEAGHILIRVRVTVGIFLSYDVLFLLRSSVCAWLLIHHERCLRGLVLIWTIKVWKVGPIVSIKRILPIFIEATSDLHGLLLMLRLVGCIIGGSRQAINSLLLLVRVLIDRTWNSWFWIFQVCWH